MYVLHSDSGSRFVINKGVNFYGIDLTYDSISGNLSDGLMIKNMQYKDQVVDIKIKKLSYRSNWSWLSQHLELTNFDINDVVVMIKSSQEPSSESQSFTGIELPLTVDIKKLLVSGLKVKSEIDAEGSLHTIDTIGFSALVEAKNTTINHLNVSTVEYDLTTSGLLDYSKGLAYDLKADWKVKPENQTIEATGTVLGNLDAIKLEQTLNFKSDQLHGQFLLKGGARALMGVPNFDLQLTSMKPKLILNEQTFELKDLAIDFNGIIDDYNISIQSDLGEHEFNDSKLLDSKIELQASGNSQQLTTEVATITTSEGLIEAQAKVDWQDQLKINSQLELTDFNLRQLLQNWPGIINGQINLNLDMGKHGLLIKTHDNLLQGELKGQHFTLTGAADYSTYGLLAEDLKLILGGNSVLVNGQVTEQKTDLVMALNWEDLSVLDQQLSGSIEGTVELSGDYKNPQLKADLSAQQLFFADNKVSSLKVYSQGQWNQQLNTDVIVKDALIGGQEFNHIEISQGGWLNSHEVQVIVDNKKINTVLNLKGQYISQTTPQQPLWKGQLLSHELVVDIDKKIELQTPIAIELGQQIKIESGCWQGVEAGTLCIEFNDTKQTNDTYQGSLKLNAFSMLPLQVFLPENIELNGTLQGAAEFSYQAGDILLDSNIKLLNGELLIKKEQETVYQTAIKALDVETSTNQNIDISINAQLEDNSFLKLITKLENPSGQEWLINSSVKGTFLSTDLIRELSEEINELEGEISIDGSITGLLTEPNINLNLNQSDGYLTLTRLGTVIENLKLMISTKGIKKPLYNISLFGTNLKSINQGRIESNGELSFSEDKQWQYQGDILGSNFMLLNLPEAKFNISPKLTVLANPDLTDIKGDLVIDSGHVMVQQLPPNSVSNSDDLQVHTSESESSKDNPLILDIDTSIKEPVKLDVIGLVAGLSGSIQLLQTKEQGLAGKGTLSLSDGSYEIYGQKLDINTGELTFSGPIDNPRINVKASRKSVSGDVVAGVQLGGSVNDLQSNLYSEPNLADIEKLSYIMSGRGIDGSGNLDGESLKQAAIVMGLNQSSPIFNQIQNQFGIDVLTVRESAVTADTVVEAGKKINDKLYVSYNQGLFNRLGFWMLKYRINQFLNLETTQGEDQSVELIYTRKARSKNSEPE